MGMEKPIPEREGGNIYNARVRSLYEVVVDFGLDHDI